MTVVLSLLIISAMGGLSQSLEPPFLSLRENEITIQEGSNLHVECYGFEPIIWTYFPQPITNADTVIYSSASYEIFDEIKEENDNYTHKAVLNIRNASYASVNYYYCHNRGANYNAENNSTKFYLYVNDTKQQHVIPGNTVFVEVRKHSNWQNKYVIPCRPTLPDTNVTLTKTRLKLGKIVSYDSKIGFILEAHEKIGSVEHNLGCHFGTSKTSDVRVIFIIIESEGMIRPTILDESKDKSAIIGGTIRLKCSVKLRTHPLYIKWMRPKYLEGAEFKDQVLAYKVDGAYSTTLIVPNATKSDEGTYTCVVWNVLNETRRNSMDISIAHERYTHEHGKYII